MDHRATWHSLGGGGAPGKYDSINYQNNHKYYFYEIVAPCTLIYLYAVICKRFKPYTNMLMYACCVKYSPHFGCQSENIVTDLAKLDVFI